ncbi:MAG: outer membrane beta-barrel protein [Bacteroidota bacterium]|jgi:hypothetical protein
MTIIQYLAKCIGAIALLTMITAPLMTAQVDLKAGAGVGITSAVSDLNGSTMEYYTGTKYGQNSGLNIHGKGKVGLGRVDLVGEINFSSLGNTGNSEPGQGSVEITQKILSLKVGPEFHITIPALPIRPYAGVNLAWNRFSGEANFQGVSKIPSATYSVKEATRLGAGFTIGAEVSIGPLLSLDFTTAYNFMNISGNEWLDMNPAGNERIDSYLALNDSKDPLYAVGDDKHFISNDRSIHSMLFTVSLLFGL